MSSLLIRGAQINTALHRDVIFGDILVLDGKIAAIGSDLSCPQGIDILEAKDLFIYPGFVEAHCHIGLSGNVGFVSKDHNEKSDPLTPHLRAIDAINPFAVEFKEAALAGVTTVATGPGSANPVGGLFAALKTYGRRVDDMLVKDAVAMKCAFGENVKGLPAEKAHFTRMGAVAKIRDLLFKTKEYAAKLELAKENKAKTPDFDIKLEAMLPVLRGEIPLKAHAHQANDIFTAIRIAKEFNLKMSIEHCTEGHLIADYLAAEEYPLAIGPGMSFNSKFELLQKTFSTPGILAKAGCLVSIITDSPVTLQEYLPIAAGLAIKAGMQPFEALKAITINPARTLGIENRVGSIAPGKDADLVLADGNVFEIATRVVETIIDGKLIQRK